MSRSFLMRTAPRAKAFTPFQWEPLSNETIKKTVQSQMFLSWSKQADWNPPVIVKAEGSHVWDETGKKYFDANSMLMCSNIGHGDMRIVDTITRAQQEVQFAGPPYATEWRARATLALDKLHNRPGSRYFFSLSGAEANENAIKFARMATGRHKILTRTRTYHGATNLTVNLTGDYRRLPNEPAPPGIVRVRDAYPYRCPLRREGDTDAQHTALLLEDLETTIRYEGADKVAAFILEPIVGTNGIIIPPEGYLQGVQALCRRYGIMLIADEVMCGVGRTGKFWGHQHWGVEPDIISAAKGITSAYLPLGVTIVAPHVAKHFDQHVFSGGLTYAAHPVCMAAAAAVLRVVEEDKVVERAATSGAYVKKRLQEIGQRHNSVGDVRSIGLFSGLEIVKDRATKAPLAEYPAAHPAFGVFAGACKADGILLYVNAASGIVHFNPPLTSETADLDDALSIIDTHLSILDKAAAQ